MMEASEFRSAARAPRRGKPKRQGRPVRNAGVLVMVSGAGAPGIAPVVDQVAIVGVGARDTHAER